MRERDATFRNQRIRQHLHPLQPLTFLQVGIRHFFPLPSCLDRVPARAGMHPGDRIARFPRCVRHFTRRVSRAAGQSPRSKNPHRESSTQTPFPLLLPPSSSLFPCRWFNGFQIMAPNVSGSINQQIQLGGCIENR